MRLGPIIHIVLAVIATLDAVKKSDTKEKVLWLLLIWLVPFVGPIIYLVAGKNK